MNTQRRPNLEKLLKKLDYKGTVDSMRTVYYVYAAGEDFYMIFSIKNSNYKAGNFNVVSTDMVNRIMRTFGGKSRITRRNIEENPRMKKFVGTFDVLQTLYVIVAMGWASIDKRSPNANKLYFNIRKR